MMLFAGIATAVAAGASAQTARVSLRYDNSAAKEVVEEIERQTDYLFVYREEMVDLSYNVSVRANSQPVSKVLDKVFADTDTGYAVHGDNIILLPKASLQEQVAKQSVSGIVQDEDGRPIAGVTVLEQGSQNVALTGTDGQFSIQVGADAVLLVQFIGYLTQEITVGTQTRIDIIMYRDTRMIDEVVVVGFGTQKKVNLTGAVSSVKGEDMAIRPLSNTASMLQGQIPGLYVTQSTGQPGEESVTFRIRGTGSYGSSNNPLVLINGVEGSMTNLDPNMIESVNVLKDAASAAIYGSRAANGVILITTKQGATRGDGKPQISYSGVFSRHSPTKMFDLVTNSAEYMTLANIANANSGRSNSYPEAEIEKYRNGGGSEQYPNFDWLGYMFRPAFMNTHNLSLAGTTDKTTYNMSLNYLNQEGTLRGHSFKRYNFTIDLTTQATKWLKVGTFATMMHGDRVKTRQNQDDAFLSTMSQAPTYMPWLPDDGSGIKKWTNAAYGYEDHNKNMAAIVGEGIMAPRKEYDMNAQVWTEVKFLDHFTWHTKAAARYYSYRIENWRGKPTPIYMYHTGEQSGSLDKGGQGFNVDEYRDFATTLHSYLRFDWASASSAHNVSAMAGYSQETFRNETLAAYRQDYPFPLHTINAGGQTNWSNGGGKYEWALQSLYGRVTYNYKERYLLEVNARYDGSSRLSPQGRWGMFPSVSGAWRFTEENFMEGTRNWLSYGKIRASWGQLGNQNMNDSDGYQNYYPYQAMISSVSAYPFDKTKEESGYIQTAFNNEFIKWERATITDVGIDLQLFDHLDITFDWYNKVTSDILRGAQVSTILGLSAPTINGGKMQNRGIELAVTWQDRINSGAMKGLTWYAGISYDRNRNKLLEYGAQSISGQYLRREGVPYNSFYMLKYIGVFADQAEIDASPKQFNDNTQPGDLKYADLSGPDGVPDGKIDDNDRTVISGYYPGFEYSVKLGASWKGIDLAIFGTGVQDKKFWLQDWGVYPFKNGSAPTRDYLKSMWTPENPNNAKHPKLYWDNLGGTKNTRYNTYLLRDASYFRVKNITLGYTLPGKWTDAIGISGVRVYASADNVLTITKFDGLDPERTANGRAAQYPQNRSYSLGLNIQF